MVNSMSLADTYHKYMKLLSTLSSFFVSYLLAANDATLVQRGAVDDMRFLLWMILGAVFGATISVAIKAPDSFRDGVSRWLASMAIAIIGTPMVMHYTGVVKTSDFALSISGLTGLLGWFIVPAMIEAVKNKLKNWSNR